MVGPVKLTALSHFRFAPTPGDRAFLTETLAKLQHAYDSLELVLPQGVIHGDASVGNVLLDSRGTPVLIDLDGFALGPTGGPRADRHLP